MANELQVYIKELGDASWTDITSRVVKANFKIKEGFGSLGGSLNLSKLDITYKASDLAVASIFHTTAKLIRIKKNGAVIWEGFTEGSSTVNSTDSSKLAWVKVTAYPYIHALEKIVAPSDEVFYDIYISKQTTDKSSLLEILWARMISNAESPYKDFLKDSVTVLFPTINVKRAIAVIEEGDNYLTTFNEILKQYGYVVHIDGFIVRFVQPFADDYREIKQIPFSMIESKPTIKTAPYKTNSRPIITISKIITKDNCQVYSLAQEGENAEHELYINATFPDEGEYEDIKYGNQNIETDNISFYYAKNPTMSYQARYSDNSADAVLLEIKKELNGTGAKIKLKNTSTVLSCYLNQLKITAEKAYFLDKTTQVTPNDTVKGDKKEETTEWLGTETDANNYINYLLAEQKAETSSFTFKSELLGNEVKPNTLIKIGDIQALYLVRSISTDITNDEKEYSCVLFELQKKTTKVYAIRGLRRVGAKGNKGDKGANGTSNALITLYKRSASQPTAYDGGALTYTFATDTLSGNLGTWSRSISTGSSPLYAITARAYGTGETDIIDIGEWSTPAILSENGTKGENGSTVAVITLYKRGDTAPDKPSKTVTFSFHSYTVTNADGWSLGIPSGTAPCWSIYATAVSSDGVSDTIESGEWSTPVKAFENGEKGDKGEQGVKGEKGPQGEKGDKGATGSPGKDGTNGKDGKGIKSSVVTFQAGSSQKDKPTGTWSTAIPATSETLPYLWTRTVITYTDDTTSEIYTVGVGLNGTHVGGRNLIRGTADQRSGDCGVYKGDNSFFNNDIKYGKADTFKSQTPWSGCPYDFYSLYKRENLKVGDVVTFSIRVLANFTPKKAVQMTLYRVGSTQDGQNNANIILGTKTLEPNKWYTYSATWAITQANLDIAQDNASNQSYPRAEVDYYDPDIYAEHKTYTFGEGNYIYIGGMKLEKGNIATDWTPAPEDEIKTVSTEYYLSTSATALSGGSWSTTAPNWANGKYMWMRTVVTNGYGDKTYTPSANGVCIAGAKGDSVVSELQYHLDVSASLTTSQLQALANDSWSTESTWEYGRYIYKRTKKTNLGTGAIEYTYQGRDEELENHFKSLLSFKLSANRLNYPIDKRALDAEKTTIKISIDEQYYHPDSYYIAINGEVQTPTITNNSFTFDVLKKTGKDLYNVVVIPKKDGANITDVAGELNIIALDITEYDKFYGAVTSLTFSGITLLTGDSCFLTEEVGDNEANKIYVYQSNAWVDFNNANLTTDKRMLILSKAQKTAIEFANLKGTIAAEYAYIGTLIANYVYAREIGAETITLTGDKGKLVGGDYTTEDEDGFLANRGVYIDSTGTAKLNDAKLKNCKIDSGEINNITITGVVNNDVLTTTVTASAGESISIGNVDDTNKWYLKSQAEAKIKSLITANQLYSFSNGENINGNASLKLLNNTDDSWASSGAIPNYYYISQAINGISAGVDTTGDYGGMAYGNGYLIWGSYRTFFRIKIATDSGAGFTYNSFDNISEKIPWYNKNLSRYAKTRIVFNKDNNLFYLFCNYADLSAGDNYNKCFFATSSNGDSWSVGVNGSPFECSFSSNFYAQYMEDSKSIYLWGTKKGDTKTTQVEVYSTNGYGTNDTASIEALNLTLYTMMATSKHLDYMATIDTGAYVQETKVYYKNGGTITSFHEATNLPSGKLTRFIKFKSNLYAIFNYNALYKISDDTYAPVFTKVFDFSSPSATTTNLNVFITEDYLIIKKKIGETYYNYIYDGTNYYTPQGTENWIDNAFLWNSEIDIYPICNGKNVYYTYDNKLIRVYRGKRGFQQKLVVLGGDYNDLGAFSTYVSGTLINTPIKASSLNLPTTIPTDMDTYRKIPTLFAKTDVYLSLASASVESYTRFDTSTKQDVIVPAYSGKPNKVTTSPQVFTINNTEYANSSWFIKNKTALAISFTPNAVAKGVYTGDLNPKEVDGEAASNRDIGNITPYDTITGREITANEKLIAGNIKPKTASANIGSANQKFDNVYAKTVNSQTENTDTINSSNVNITSKFRVQTDKVEIGADIESGYVNIRNIDLNGVFWHIDVWHDQLRFVRQGSTVPAYITEAGLYGAVFN